MSLRITDSIKLYVHVGRLKELVTFLVCKRSAIPAKQECDFCAQFVECTYPRTSSAELTDGSGVATKLRSGEQQSTSTTSGNNALTVRT